MIDQAAIGASVTMTPKEVDALCGDGGIRLVTCPNGRVIGGVGAVGLVEHVGVTDVKNLIAAIQAKRDELARIAAGPQPSNIRENLYTFTRI